MKVGMNKVAAVLASFALMSGLFMGMKLDANASNRYDILRGKNDGTAVSSGDVISLKESGTTVNLKIYYQFNSNASYECRHVYSNTDYYADYSKPALTYTVQPQTYQGNIYENYTLRVEYTEKNGASPGAMYRYYNVYLIANAIPSETSIFPNNNIAPHIHDFQWITTIDPQCGADGLEEYKCVGCGIVQESHAIPAGIALVKDLYGKVKEAPVNGEVVYDFGKLATISDYLLTKMAERNDVAVTIQFEHNGGKHQLTFPAGTDYTAVLTDADNMYGFYGIASKLGLAVTDIAK